MATNQLSQVVQHLCAAALPPTAASLTDGQLLECFIAERDEAAFEALVRRHADMVCEALKGCLPRRKLTSTMLLPEGSEKQITSDFVGVLGSFEIYRGSSRGHRMANLRLVLR